MKFKLDTSIPEFRTKVTYKQPILFLGSCFSDEIAAKFKNAGFEADTNPNGTIFHPIPIARFIRQSIAGDQHFKIESHASTFFSFETSNLFNFHKEELLLQFLIDTRQQFLDQLKVASHLFVTLGTAWGYLHHQNEMIVANCHKIPSASFQKELTPLSQLTEYWKKAIEEIRNINPSISIIFTVSPVRHSKDGLIENNRSKARLFELIFQLQDELQIEYFPSYELVIDELRDYRFFKEDLVHPTKQAIQYIWEKIKLSFFDSDTLKLVEKVENMRKLQHHRIQGSNEIERITFEKERKEKINKFIQENPEVKF